MLKAPNSAFLLLAALIVGCSVLGVEKPTTFNQRLAYVYGVETAAAQQLAEKTRSGSISSADNAKFVALLENSKAIADGAHAAMEGGDTSTAEGKLTLAKNILTEVDTYVRSKK